MFRAFMVSMRLGSDVEHKDTCCEATHRTADAAARCGARAVRALLAVKRDGRGQLYRHVKMTVCRADRFGWTEA